MLCFKQLGIAVALRSLKLLDNPGPSMKPALAALFVAFLSVTSASAAISYNDLEHLTTSYRDSLNALPGRTAFVNFQTTRGSTNYMVTLFFGLDSPLERTVMNGDAVTDTNTYSFLRNGPVGIFAYNMDLGIQQVISSLSPVTSNSLTFTEVNQGISNSYYEDQIEAISGGYVLYFFDHNASGPSDTTGIINTSGIPTGNAYTAADVGFPFSIANPANSEVIIHLPGQRFTGGANNFIGTGIHSMGVIVPEPSSLLLLAGAGLFGMARRRR